MKESFEVDGVCTSRIDIELDGSIIKSVNFHRGCPGNLLGISKLVKGMEAGKVIKMFDGSPCGIRPTSCPDQLAKSLKAMISSKACCA
ncbi:MAG: TIGR03905 family TSCPD domain-containing protein [Spirochaetales bacterium]|nr:TIGR03905 family TSCPD domain-containing protein [Spirochaetales bacterium]